MIIRTAVAHCHLFKPEQAKAFKS